MTTRGITPAGRGQLLGNVRLNTRLQLKAVARIFREELKKRVPVDTGRLRRTVRVRATRTKVVIKYTAPYSIYVHKYYTRSPPKGGYKNPRSKNWIVVASRAARKRIMRQESRARRGRRVVARARSREGPDASLFRGR